jgi:hypothetical protein
MPHDPRCLTKDVIGGVCSRERMRGCNVCQDVCGGLHISNNALLSVPQRYIYIYCMVTRFRSSLMSFEYTISGILNK